MGMTRKLDQKMGFLNEAASKQFVLVKPLPQNLNIPKLIRLLVPHYIYDSKAALVDLYNANRLRLRERVYLPQAIYIRFLLLPYQLP